MAMILDAFVGKLVERLAAFVEEDVSSVLGVKDELKSMQKKLVKIGAVFKDAERRRIQDEAVKQWLNDLKDVVYDADDILDLCIYNGGLLRDDTPSSTSPVDPNSASSSEVVSPVPVKDVVDTNSASSPKVVSPVPREGEMVYLNSVNSNPRLDIESQVPEEEVVYLNSVSSNPRLDIESQVPEEEEVREETSTSTSASPTSDQDSTTTEELKQACKFSYFATALAGGGMLSLLIFHLENKSGEPHTLIFKTSIFFILATFTSGLSIILLTICAPVASYQMSIIRGLVYATLVFLALTGVGVSITLLKAVGELAFVPSIVVVVVSCIIVYYKKKERSGQYLLRQRSD